MNKEIVLKVRVNSAKDIIFVFQKIGDIAKLVGMDKIEIEMQNREGLLSALRGVWGWIIR